MFLLLCAITADQCLPLIQPMTKKSLFIDRSGWDFHKIGVAPEFLSAHEVNPVLREVALALPLVEFK